MSSKEEILSILADKSALAIALDERIIELNRELSKVKKEQSQLKSDMLTLFQRATNIAGDKK